MIFTMITTMDAAGRLVIPREIRREAALEPDMPLEVRWRDGVIEIEPQPLAVTLERKGRLLVAKPTAKAAPLRTATVERTRRDVAGRRGRR
jgi:bifunctional DNA-binding transcriptional regulator/antitoxin component of YhaV-PrlF toxin-antitoxin module